MSGSTRYVRRNGAFIQRQRIHQIAKDLQLELKKNEGAMSLKKFQAYCQFNYGLNWKTTRKYLETLEIMEFCKVDDKNGVIYEYYELDLTKPSQTETSQDEVGMGI